MEHDWSRFIKKININVPVEFAYLAWTTPQILEKWFLRTAVFHSEDNKRRTPDHTIQAGDHYEWLWHGHPDTAIEKGVVIEANGKDRLQFSFTGGGVVTVDISKVMDETIVMLTQEKIPTDEHGKIHYNVECQTGWAFYLTNLKSYLEGGLDLRNKNLAFANMVNS